MMVWKNYRKEDSSNYSYATFRPFARPLAFLFSEASASFADALRRVDARFPSVPGPTAMASVPALA